MAQRINTLPLQDNQFIEWYIKTGYAKRYIQFEVNEFVYLPYTGKDETFIYTLFETFFTLKYPGYLLDEPQKTIIKKLIDIHIHKSKRSGMFLSGPIGTGKTMLLAIWLEFRQKLLSPTPVIVDIANYNETKKLKQLEIWVTSSRDLKIRLKDEGYCVFEDIPGDIVLFDDFGLGADTNYYGQSLNVNEQFIYGLYDKFKSHANIELYISSNLTFNEVKDHFNLRAYSRLLEMVNPEYIISEDHRKNDDCIKVFPTFSKPKNKDYKPEKW